MVGVSSEMFICIGYNKFPGLLRYEEIKDGPRAIMYTLYCKYHVNHFRFQSFSTLYLCSHAVTEILAPEPWIVRSMQ